jgi:hypothetical protein
MFAGRGKRIKKRIKLDSPSFIRGRRLAAAMIVDCAASGMGFGDDALEAATEAFLRHPHAGDAQIIAFLRWFSGDGNPMP